MSINRRPQAYHMHPWDKAILYNIAMIQQKAAEMLLSVPPAKRSLKELERAIEQAGHAQKCVFLTFPLPLSSNLAFQLTGCSRRSRRTSLR